MGKSLLEFQSNKGDVLPPHKVLLVYLVNYFSHIYRVMHFYIICIMYDDDDDDDDDDSSNAILTNFIHLILMHFIRSIFYLLMYSSSV